MTEKQLIYILDHPDGKKKLPEVFAVTHSPSRFALADVLNIAEAFCWEWDFYESPEKFFEISRSTAKRLISEEGLVRVTDDGHGSTIYDRPGEPFKTRFDGYFEGKRRKLSEERSERLTALNQEGKTGRNRPTGLVYKKSFEKFIQA